MIKFYFLVISYKPENQTEFKIIVCFYIILLIIVY